MEWRLLREDGPRDLVEHCPVSVYIAQLDEFSFADLCREIQAMSSEAALDEVAGLQPQAEVEWERRRRGLGTAGRSGR
jgi:hypothetical protein